MKATTFADFQICISVPLACISKHDDFSSFTQKHTLDYLVTLCDRESCGLEKKNYITNR